MIWNRDSDRTFFQLSLHDYVATSPACFNKTVFCENVTDLFS